MEPNLGTPHTVGCSFCTNQHVCAVYYMFCVCACLQAAPAAVVFLDTAGILDTAGMQCLVGSAFSGFSCRTPAAVCDLCVVFPKRPQPCKLYCSSCCDLLQSECYRNKSHMKWSITSWCAVMLTGPPQACIAGLLHAQAFTCALDGVYNSYLCLYVSMLLLCGLVSAMHVVHNSCQSSLPASGSQLDWLKTMTNSTCVCYEALPVEAYGASVCGVCHAGCASGACLGWQENFSGSGSAQAAQRPFSTVVGGVPGFTCALLS